MVRATLASPAVPSQTFRALVRSRLVVGMSRYDERFPDADVVLIEPGTWWTVTS